MRCEIDEKCDLVQKAGPSVLAASGQLHLTQLASLVSRDALRYSR